MEQRSRVAGVVIVAVLVTAGVVFFGSGSVRVPPLPPSAFAELSAPAAGAITVHVAGEVAEPGLVRVVEGARVADALAAAGGGTAAADLGSLNLAAPLRDGDRILVPAEAGEGEADTAGVAPDGRVRINIASVGELQSLPGVGPVLAQRIVEFVEAQGPLTVVEELLDVPGIGEAKLAALREAVALP